MGRRGGPCRVLWLGRYWRRSRGAREPWGLGGRGSTWACHAGLRRSRHHPWHPLDVCAGNRARRLGNGGRPVPTSGSAGSDQLDIERISCPGVGAVVTVGLRRGPNRPRSTGEEDDCAVQSDGDGQSRRRDISTPLAHAPTDSRGPAQVPAAHPVLRARAPPAPSVESAGTALTTVRHSPTAKWMVACEAG